MYCISNSYVRVDRGVLLKSGYYSKVGSYWIIINNLKLTYVHLDI